MPERGYSSSLGLFSNSFAEPHPRWKTSVVTIVAQGVWAVVLVFSGTYGQLLDHVVFADWIFFGLTAATLFVIRRRDGIGGEGFRVPLHPWTTLLFIAAAVYVVIGSVTSNSGNALRGLGLLALGVPTYLYWQRRTGTQ